MRGGPLSGSKLFGGSFQSVVEQDVVRRDNPRKTTEPRSTFKPFRGGATKPYTSGRGSHSALSSRRRGALTFTTEESNAEFALLDGEQILLDLPSQRGFLSIYGPPIRPVHGSRTFTRLDHAVAAFLRELIVQICVYLDDWLIVAESWEDLVSDTRKVLDVASSLGWLINKEKSFLIPSQQVTYLGAGVGPFQTTRGYRHFGKVCPYYATSAHYLPSTRPARGWFCSAI
ncbi:reverse transcriptase [Apostichopus japonicus]|uniref:Reverse transcriptase n=1 Tax=Stichopus japonicus TaxID=307972 RepID=A0A2G8JH02_STIJA|nr:reverse transcriptase [Apostichopus japonicus]